MDAVYKLLILDKSPKRPIQSDFQNTRQPNRIWSR